MNLLNFKTVKTCTRIGLFIAAFFVQVSVKAWEVDFSRRQKDLNTLRRPASIVDQPVEKKDDSFLGLGSVLNVLEPSQEIVILNTEKGFVPETLRLKKGQNYKIHIVNVNEKEKNTSFILDAFSEHHATYYGQAKSFAVSPKVDGVFSFQCPETAKQGKIIIFSDSERKPAAQ